MNLDANSWVGLAIVAAVIGWFLWKHFVKPAPINLDHILAITGSVGSGKTLNSVKIAVSLYKKSLSAWRKNCLWLRVKNWFIKEFHLKKPLYEMPEMPFLISNVPVRWGWPWAYHWSVRLVPGMLLTDVRIPGNSVVLIDEFPSLCNQFDWDNPLVKDRLNDFLTFFRHWTNGYLVTNAQSFGKYPKVFRDDCGTYYNVFDCHAYFGLVYSVSMVRVLAGDLSVAVTSEYLGENAKKHYGLLIPRRYDSRCYRHMYDVVTKKDYHEFYKLTTNIVTRLDPDRVGVLDERIKKAGMYE